jgi:hypothetical protein
MLVLVRLEIMLILMQDNCSVCTDRTIGTTIILDAPNGTPRCRGSGGNSFRSVWRQCLRQGEIGAWFAPIVP